MHGFLTVLYTEGEPDTYKGVRASVDEDIELTVNTGKGPPFDYLAAHLWLLVCKGVGAMVCSSSVDHFESDGGSLGHDIQGALFIPVLTWLKGEGHYNDDIPEGLTLHDCPSSLLNHLMEHSMGHNKELDKVVQNVKDRLGFWSRG